VLVHLLASLVLISIPLLWRLLPFTRSGIQPRINKLVAICSSLPQKAKITRREGSVLPPCPFVTAPRLVPVRAAFVVFLSCTVSRRRDSRFAFATADNLNAEMLDYDS
jgi:hypothetical protein